MRSNRFFFLAPWGVLVALLVAATAATRSLGFRVWPFGESRNWLWILKIGPGIEAAAVHWQVDYRNPLSPWWYIVLRPFFEKVEPAFVILQLLMGPALGISVYLLVAELSRRKAPLLAGAAGVLTSLFLASPYVDGVTWNFVGALAASVLSVWSYLRSTRAGKAWLWWRVISVVFWLVAITTYTLQCGAVIAIGLLALSVRSGDETWLARVRRAAFAILPYVVLFAVFLVLWKLYDRAGVMVSPLRPSLRGLVQSIGEGLWPKTIPTLLATSAASLSPSLAIVFFLAPALAAAFVLLRVPAEGDESFSWRTIFSVAIVACSLVAPTVALEASSSTWAPGTRWPMLEQLWTPLLALMLLVVVLNIVASRAFRRWAFIAVVSALAGYASLAVAAMNRRQVEFTAMEKKFFAGLRGVVEEDIAAKKQFPRHYLVDENSGSHVPSDEFPSRSYTDTLYPDLPRITYRYTWPRGPETVVFGPEGVTNASRFDAEAPYSRVERLAWDGAAFRRLPLP